MTSRAPVPEQRRAPVPLPPSPEQRVAALRAEQVTCAAKVRDLRTQITRIEKEIIALRGRAGKAGNEADAVEAEIAEARARRILAERAAAAKAEQEKREAEAEAERVASEKRLIETSGKSPLKLVFEAHALASRHEGAGRP